MRVRNLVILVLIVGAVAYVVIWRRGDVEKTAKGFKPAETPQVAADMFKKAVKDREYEIAADYCTASYAEQLKRGGKAANEFATTMDALVYQLDERKLVRDELKKVFQALDPFPNDLTITVAKESAETAEATLTFANLQLRGDQPASGDWTLDPKIYQIYIRSMKFVSSNTVIVPMKKEKDGWKFDFPSDAALQNRVGRFNEKYKNYVNPFEVIKQEVKNDPTTKENVTSRLKTELEKAAKE